jgi:hypothetical protein
MDWKLVPELLKGPELERIADGDIGHRETPGAEILPPIGQAGLGPAQPPEIELAVVLNSLGEAPFGGLDKTVTEADRQWESEGGVRLVQPIEIIAVGVLPGLDRQGCGTVPVSKILTNGRALSHANRPVDQERHGPQRVDGEIFSRERARRERP